MEREVGVGVAAEDGAPPLDVLGDGHARGVARGRQVKITREVDDRVTPPKAAARVAASGGWVMTSGFPAHISGTGMLMCACGSMPPGTTILPRA